jgi:drug/metabolite transporter (DMT)-like permease
MKATILIRLFLLAAIWGSSFIFMRVLSPVLGALVTSNLRILIAGIFLVIYFHFIKFDPEWKKNFKHYLIIGIINSAIPFSLFAFGALSLPASYEVILNSTAPLFGAIFSWMWLAEKMNFKKSLGLFTSIIGVAIVVDFTQTRFSQNYLTAIGACLLASLCYGLGATYIKKFGTQLKPLGIAGGSQFIAGLIMIPLSFYTAPHLEMAHIFNVKIILCILGLALLCSALAYLLYYQILSEAGSTIALGVTFLMPIFGVVWGKLFLNELITLQMIVGAFIILLGTYITAILGKK